MNQTKEVHNMATERIDQASGNGTQQQPRALGEPATYGNTGCLGVQRASLKSRRDFRLQPK